MIHAYDEACLERASDTLGRMLDFAAHSLHRDPALMMGLFTATGLASRFGHGDIRLAAGMSGMELAYEILERSGLTYERTTPRHTRSLSAEYWLGRTLARAQWETGASFDQILSLFSLPGFISQYNERRMSFLDGLPLDINEAERASAIRSFGIDFSDSAAADIVYTLSPDSNVKRSADTPLKKMRIKNGLSQSGLAEASGIPLRTIQQYEQRQKDLSRASAEYIVKLSNVLCCAPASLLE